MNAKEMVDKLRNESETFDEQQEYVQQKAVELAVRLADSVIMEASEGSVEETNMLTAMVAEKFADKVLMACRSAYNRKTMLERMKK